MHCSTVTQWRKRKLATHFPLPSTFPRTPLFCQTLTAPLQHQTIKELCGIMSSSRSSINFYPNITRHQTFCGKYLWLSLFSFYQHLNTCDRQHLRSIRSNTKLSLKETSWEQMMSTLIESLTSDGVDSGEAFFTQISWIVSCKFKGNPFHSKTIGAFLSSSVFTKMNLSL